ncbi:MAG: SCO family protein [Thioalkalispiraceae bacterium]|jgi:protein SCO1/2
MNTPTHQSRPLVVLVSIAIVALLAGVLFWLFLKPTMFSTGERGLPKQIASVYIPKSRPLAGIRLTDHNNELFTEESFKGKWSFLFFGFTHCPDVCPTTLLVMKAVWARLPESAKQAPEPQLLFVSVDPDRDTPELMKSYTTFYHPDFLGVTAEHKYLDILTTQVGALYGYEDGETAETYTVNHSAQIILIDPQGYFRAVFSPPHNVDEIVKTFTAIRAYHPGVE